jgi:hypothetical protein
MEVEKKEEQPYLMSDAARKKCEDRTMEIFNMFNEGMERIAAKTLTGQEDLAIEIEALMRAACVISANIIAALQRTGLDSIVLYNLHCQNLMTYLNVKEDEDAKKENVDKN